MRKNNAADDAALYWGSVIGAMAIVFGLNGMWGFASYLAMALVAFAVFTKAVDVLADVLRKKSGE